MQIGIFQSVSENEGASLRAVGVKVDVHLQIGTLVDNVFLGGEDCGVLVLRGLFVATIEVDSKSVEPPVAAGHTVRIQHWDDLPHVVLQQQLALVSAKIC